MTSAVCADCGQGLVDGARFCPFCGAPVVAPAAEIRKTVTLLFCDVTGSTALGEQLDPEVLRGVMTRYFTLARACVERHGGVVEKFVGDAVLAVFGVPDAHEDDALRAVRAAAELRSELAGLSRDLHAEVGAHLQVRTGVNTGSVIVGAGRAGGSFATGDAVNTAARLEQAAAPGEILLGELTRSLVRDAVVVEPVASLSLKGKAEPVPAYRLREVLEVDRGRVRPAAEVLVGRDAVAQLIRDAAARSGGHGRLELVTVLGAAGIGKSTLLAHVLDDLRFTARVLSGRCPSYGHGITFWPVTQMIRQAADLPLDATADDARDALLMLLADYPDADLAVGHLLALLGLTGEPGSRDETFWAVRTLFGRLAETGPLVITVDDAHWAEPMLLDLLDGVRDELRDAPVLLLVQARPELLELRPVWGSGSSNAAVLSLEPLSAEQTGEVLQNLFGAVPPPELVSAVDGWAAGNPLYVVELVTHLLETGALTVDDAGWTIASPLSTISVPPGVSAVLAARIDRLPTPERALLDRLSVIGLEFEPDDAGAVAPAGTDDAALGTLLAGLQRRDILRRHRGRAGTIWSFRHVLVREAAYESMPKALRAEIHERFADRLLDTATDAGAETITFRAHHLEQAARLQRELSAAPAVLTRTTDRAVDALTEATRRAIDGENIVAAVELADRALALLADHDPRRWSLLLDLTLLRLDQSQVEPARQLLTRLEEFRAARAGKESDPLVAVTMLVLRQRIALEAAEPINPSEVEALSNRLLTAARQREDGQAAGLALRSLVMVGAMRGRWTDVAVAGEALRSVGDARSRRFASAFGQAAAVWGPLPVTDGLRQLADTEPDASATPMVRLIHAMSGLALLGYDGQHAQVRQGVADIAPIIDQHRGVAEGHAGFMLHRAFAALSDDEQALTWLQRGVAAMEADGALSYVSSLLVEEAMTELHRSRWQEAEALVARAAAVTSPYDTLTVGLVQGCRSVLADHHGERDEAADLARQALATLDGTDQIVDMGDLRRLLAVAARDRGDLGSARTLLLEARDRYAAKGATALVARADWELAALPA